MKIDVFAICYNEEFMLPLFIAHYKKMGANITIYDNFSTDKSKKIILDAGCTYLTYDSENQIRDDLYLHIKNNCWKKSTADWVIVCDIDEFIEVPFNIDRYTIINTQGYDMIGFPPTRKGVKNPIYSKHIMFRPDQFKQIGYQPGCHSCKPEGTISGSKELANLLHYKYISPSYVFYRHLIYQNRLSAINKKYGWGAEYEKVDYKKITEKIIKMQGEAIEIPAVQAFKYSTPG